MYFEMDCACKGKNLDKMLQPAILSLLYNRECHGFAIMQELGDGPMFRGLMPDKAGVYRYLKKMEESGLLTSSWDEAVGEGKPRKVYRITEKGRQCLANWLYVLKQYQVSIDHLIGDVTKALMNGEQN